MVSVSSAKRLGRKYLRIAVGRFFRYGFLGPIVNLISRVFYANNHQSSSIHELDQILDQAFSFEEFIRNKNLLNQYYSGLSRYFGANKFPRCSFDALVDQLILVSEKVPGFAEQVWENKINRIRAFELVTQGSTTGRTLNFNLWKLYRFDWLNQLKKNFEKHFPEVSSKEITQRAKEYFAQLEAEVICFEASFIIPNRLHQKDLRMVRAHAFKEFSADPLLNAYASFFLYEYMTSQDNRFFFQISDADLIIDFIKNLKQNPRSIFSGGEEMLIPSPLLGVIKKLIPNFHDLLADKNLFVENTKGGSKKQKSSHAVYRTQFIRPFHGLWLGITSNDCLAGDPTMLDHMTPARWAISALEGARSAVLEKNGSFHGFVQCIPMETAQKEIYGSIELWASVFNNKFIFVNEKSHAKVSMNFFEAWFEQFAQSLPKHWKGVIASESRFIDNIGVKKSIFLSSHWKHGRDLGLVDGLHHLDMLALDISRVVKPKGRAAVYCNEMVFDATIADAGQLRVLKSASVHEATVEEIAAPESYLLTRQIVDLRN